MASERFWMALRRCWPWEGVCWPWEGVGWPRKDVACCKSSFAELVEIAFCNSVKESGGRGTPQESGTTD